MVIQYKKEGNNVIQKGESEDKTLKVIKSGSNKEGSQTFKHQNMKIFLKKLRKIKRNRNKLKLNSIGISLK